MKTAQDFMLEVPVLKFNRASKGIFPGNERHLVNNSHPMFDVAHMIVGHFKNEEIIEQFFVHTPSPRIHSPAGDS